MHEEIPAHGARSDARPDRGAARDGAADHPSPHASLRRAVPRGARGPQAPRADDAGRADARVYGVKIVELEAPHGDTVAPDRIADALKANPATRAVLVQHSESSTGVLHDVRAYARVTHGTDTILI